MKFSVNQTNLRSGGGIGSCDIVGWCGTPAAVGETPRADVSTCEGLPLGVRRSRQRLYIRLAAWVIWRATSG